ncbi:MAG: tetratricopeptide repeat protein [Bacteroidia bacterium]|nr:tetratricopeptide repeat protein [Bacteroidia bacterium]
MKNKHRLFLAIGLFLTVIVYSKTFTNGFVNWDDDVNITSNRAIQVIHLNNIGQIFSTFNVGMYHPITTLVWALEFFLWGMNPHLFHMFSLLIHLVNVVLIYYFVRNLNISEPVALAVAFFSAVHPMHVESVAWISETKDVLYTCFFLLSMIFYLKYLRKNLKGNYLVSILLFLFSSMSKSSAVILPVLLILIDYYIERPLSVKSIIDKLPFFFIALVFGILSIYSQKYAVTGIKISEFSIVDRILIANYSVFWYLIKFLLPVNLCAFHPYDGIVKGSLPVIYYILPFISAVIVFGITKTSVYKKQLFFGLLFYLVSISLVLQLIPFGNAMVADRYTYIPYIGLLIASGTFIQQFFSSGRKVNDTIKNMMYIIILLAAIAFPFITYSRTSDWKDTISLFSGVVNDYPQNAPAHNILANALKETGDFRSAQQQYDMAIGLDPVNPSYLYNRGLVKNELKDNKGAISDYTASIRLSSKDAKVYNNRGNARASLGDRAGAMADFDRAIVLDSSFAEAYNNRGNLKAMQGDYQAALADFNHAVELNPEYTDALSNRGNVKAFLNDFQGAIIDYEKVLKIIPDDRNTLHNLELARSKQSAGKLL